MWRALLIRLLLLGALLTVGACVDVKEEVWLHSDASGRAEWTCVVPTRALAAYGGQVGIERQIDAFFHAVRGSLVGARNIESLPNGKTRLKIAMRFDHILRLRDLKGAQQLPGDVVSCSGDLKANHRGLRLSCQLQRDLATAVPMLKWLSPQLLGGGSVETILHLPIAVAESNAQRVTDSGRTLLWKTTLAQALTREQVMSLKWEIPIPWWGLAGGLGLASVTGWLAWCRRRRKRSQ